MTEKELAARLGLPLWRIERLQSGQEDPSSFVLEMAAVTGKPPEWFLLDHATPTDKPEVPPDQLISPTHMLTSNGEHAVGDQSAAEAKSIGARVERARQETGLKQKELARFLDIPLWRMEGIERGTEDPTAQLPAIAARTGRGERWFTEAAGGALSSPTDASSGEEASSDRAADRDDANAAEANERRSFRRNLVYGALALLVTIRFFSEVVHIIPRSAKLVDIPILVVLVGATLVLPRLRSEQGEGLRYLAPAVLFLIVALVSILSNLGRVAPGPVLLFLYGFLAPVAVYYTVYRLWPTGNTFSASRFLVGLAAVQFPVVVLLDLPRFLASNNPDVVSGTFGENAYQLVWYLLLTAAIVAGAYTFERRRLAARLAPLFFVATLGTILLAQYRQLLLTMVATVLLLAGLLGLVRRRGMLAVLLIALTFVLSLSYLSSAFPQLKYSSTVSTLTSDPGLYISKRLSVAGDVERLYTDNPRFILTGTGPGTYSSRAWYTFARLTQRSRGAPGVSTGHHYETDVSTKYVLPRLQKNTAEVVGGSLAITTPLTSYLSLLAELGIFGFVLMMVIYAGAFSHALRMTIRSLRNATPNDPLPGLLLGCTAGFFVLLQMAVFENWLEVTRLTFILWAVLAIATKEFYARHGAGRMEPQ